MVGLLYGILTIIGITLLPFFELRASIPAGLVLFGVDAWLLVFFVAVIANIILGIFIYAFIEICVALITRIAWIKKLYDRSIFRIQKKSAPYVHKYGWFGLAVFIGIPLPGSGVYSGAIAAKLLGFSGKEYSGAMIIGVIIAGLLVSVASISGVGIFNLFIK
jgi:uncharacterized membrane protein